LIRDITERKKAETALRESEELYRMLVEDMKDYAIYMVNPEGRIMSWNTGAERIEGYPAEEIIGQPWACLFTPEDIKRGLPAQLMARAKAEGKAVNEGWRVRKDGSRFWTHGVITALRDENGQLRGYSKLAHDITRQREADERIHQLNEELEQRVSERTAQLQAANQELEAFSYSISHDLRAPLLRISGFAEILQSEAAEGLGESSLRHLRTIAEAAQQLSTLIDALLDFSRMGRAELHLEKVDMSMLVEDARRELQADIQGREIEWRIGDLPGTHGDPLMLRQVFINLLANAIKYTRTRKPARIEIAARREGDETTYSVQDNGVGFDMQYAEKLFGVFQRLHSAQDFEGTGIGLANVRRIIRRHGGRVWAEGLVDHGATFYFTIPQQRKEGVQ
jgi:PAS domain S-box-containing protein